MQQSISRLITRRARQHPAQVVVTDADTGQTLTADALDRASNRLARDVLDRGVGTDDLVVVALPTSPQFVVTCAAIWKAGATPLPMDPDLAQGERAALERLARPRLVVGTPPADPTVPWLPDGHRPDPRTPDTPPADAWASSWKAPASSGSTGTPKIVRSTTPARFDPDTPVAPFLPRAVRQLVTGPLWHSASFTYAFRGLMTDHCLVLTRRNDEATVAHLLGAHRIGWTLLSPAMIHRLMRLPASHRDRVDTAALRSVLHLGARCPVDDKRALISWLGPDRVVEVYAGTESNGLTMIDGADWLHHPGSVGRPIGGTELRILRDDGRTAEPGETGQIWMRRPGPARYTYLGRTPHRDDDGWDSLGDVGFVDDDGYLTVRDRADDAIDCGGDPVYPADLEQRLSDHDAVRDVVVCGYRDADTDRVAVVLDIADHEVDEGKLHDFVRDRLPGHCVPGPIALRRTPLRNAAGKVRRAAVLSDTIPMM
ncbi:AMP-binding protein [Williamsia sterculiae]|uniref:Bile acid-coenzyme A ligase n=1 Tax=Williamsia sterculiae TaxID=1344003 RepID=A0A1N7ELC4_9NOCA|nr:AMP-binding protein [Williamsia sterculiae]SIR88877.1 bile acid-coenzyme A ligase [Williamsia sterculiae]